MKDEIWSLRGREVLNANGKPTVEAELTTRTGIRTTASVPSGTSTGKYEAFELYDGGERYGGYGTQKAAANVSGELNACLHGCDVADLESIDRKMCELDGTENKSRLGGNAILAVSVAAAKAGALAAGMPLYRWLGRGREKFSIPDVAATVIGGGAFSYCSLEFEDYILLLSGFKRFSEELEALSAIRRRLGENLRSKYGSFMEDGGALAPPLSSSREAFDHMLEAARQLGYEGRAALGLDVASSQLYDVETGRYRLTGHPDMTRGELIDYYAALCREYPLRLVEDGLEEDDFEGFALLKKRIPGIQIVGDDLFATNVERLKTGIARDSANTMLLKINQAGTVTQAIEACRFAQSHGYDVIVSLRSGDTPDDFAADLAVGVGARQIKAGSPVRAERNAKYNRLLKIGDELNL